MIKMIKKLILLNTYLFILDVHEKVIHLVMRAPPPLSTRGGDRRANGTAASNDSNTGASGSPGAHFRQRSKLYLQLLLLLLFSSGNTVLLYLYA